MGPASLLLAACLHLVHSARIEPGLLAEPSSAVLEPSTLDPSAPLPPSSYLEMYEAEVERHLTGGPLVDFPSELKSDYNVVKYLGAGSFGESWLVKNRDIGSSLYNEEVVMKLLYVKEGKRPEHLTWRMVQGDPFYEKSAREAARECDVAADLRRQGKDSEAPGSAHVMTCYGHNVPSKHEDVSQRMSTPLFLVLENCGGEDLTKFMLKKAKANELSVDLVGGLFKQILEGLDFLASLSEPWLHHDLKPDNIVVNSHGDGTYSAHLIDFGATVKATEAFMCKLTACTRAYAPSEWAAYKSASCPRQNFQWSQSCSSCGTAFDMFAAAAILLELVTGSRLYSLSGAWGFNSYKYGNVDAYAKSPEMINMKHVSPGENSPVGTQEAYKQLMASFLTPESHSAAFFAEAMAALRTTPSSRPTAAALLKHAFMTGARKRAISLKHVISFSACRFEKHEVVELFNYNTQDYDRATVLSVSEEGVVKVETNDPYHGRIVRHVLMCHSPRLRKLSQMQSVAPNAGFRPAAGSELPGFDSLTRITTDSNCPELCEDCQHFDNLSPRQYVCWSPTPLDDLAAQKALADHFCKTKSTYKKRKPQWTYFGYLCSP